MQQLTLYNKNQNNYISISMDFIDHYLCEAPGEFVKVYLYLLRCMEMDSRNLSVSDIADQFNYTENDVMRAFTYWEKKSLLSLEYDQKHTLCAIHFQDTSFKKEPVSRSTIREFPTLDAPKKKISRERMVQLSNEPKVKELLFIAAQYLGKTLSQTDMEVLLHIHVDLGFSCELTEYLIESCVEKNHKSLWYIEEVANQWFKNKITTVAQAKATAQACDRNCLSVMHALGISGRVLAQTEMSFVNKWLDSYGFSMDLIIEACNRTIQATSRPSFHYADTILNNWHQAKVQTKEDVLALDLQHQIKTADKPVKKPRPTPSRKNNYPERSYDYDALEQQLLNVN